MSNKEFVNKGEDDRKSIKKNYRKEKIRELRESLGLRRTEFGAKIGYTYQQVVRVEEGLTPVSEELARRICNEYQVSEEWLSGMEDSNAETRTEDSSEGRRKRLKQVYADSGLTQREFAEKTHSSAAVLRDVLSGKNQMTIHYAKKIEDAFGIGADWLLYGDEDAKECPCGDAMIRYLKKHPDVRRKIWEGMKRENESES